MTTVAEQYPARTDTNGTTWYRPGFSGKTPPAMWGWTSDRTQAHPSYTEAGVITCPAPCAECDETLIKTVTVNLTGDIHEVRTEEESPVTELLSDGTADTYRRSEVCGFPLPPFPEQVNVEMDGWKRYKLPSPTTGKLTAYTRATTVAGTTPDDYNLVQWKIRMKVEATLECLRTCQAFEEAEETGQAVDELTAAKARAYYDYCEAMSNGKGRDINNAIDRMQDLCGGAESREHGGAVHDWIAELDMGHILLHQIPEQYQVHAQAYQQAMARAGLIAVPNYTERLVLNTRGVETIAGRLDGIAYCVETGKLHVIDRKTSKTLDFSALEFGIQVAGVYSGAELMLAMDRSEWEPMPEVDQELAFIVHVPSDQPERSQVVPLAIPPGAYAMDTALQVRAERRNADKVFFGQSYPIPSAESLRYVEARQRLQNLQTPEDASEILQEYEDVMDDALMEFGAWCFELLTKEESA